ncbi:MAG: hypothetical protein RL326_922 [Pseudomonadota bacterium]|jgi:hypothetical protein
MHLEKLCNDASRPDTFQNVIRALLPSQKSLEDAVRRLQEADFHPRDIAALVPWPEPGTEFSHRAGTKAPEGALVGATIGAALGSLIGWIASTGHLPIPGILTLEAYHPLLLVLAGLGAFGVCGAIIGALVGIRIPEYETVLSEGVVPKGGLLMSVNCHDLNEERRATEILEQCGARAIASSCVKCPRGRDFSRSATSPA